MEFGSPPSTASTVEVQYAHKYPVLVRDPATGDFTTFVVTITMAQAITLVMQFGSDDDVRVFAAASTSAEDKTAVLAKCMAASVDNPVFITMPPAPVFIPPMRSVILLALDQPTQLMALCHVVSAPLQQTGDFILRHASLPESDYSHVMQVVPRIVFKSPTLLADTLAGPPASPQVQTMDAHYGLNDITRSIIRMCVPELMEWYHPMLDNAMVPHARVLALNTSYAAFQAMRILKTSLVPAFIIARFSTDVAFNLRMTTLNRLIEPLRLVLAVRAMMECQPYKSSGPSAAYLYDAMARGNVVDVTKEVIERRLSFAEFRDAMLRKERIAT